MACALCLATQAQANVGEITGLSGKAGSIAGATVASSANAMSAFENPAMLASPSDRRLSFSYGWVSLFPNLTPIQNVLISNNTVADQNLTGNVDTSSYRATLGQAIGFRYQLFPQVMNISIGVSTFMPWSALTYFDTGESFSPEYFLSRARTQRPQLDVGIAAELMPDFYVGFGARLGYSLTAKTNVFLQTDPSSPSSMRFAASLQPFPIPELSLAYAPQDGKLSGVVAGLVVRTPGQYNSSFNLTAANRVFGNTAALAFQFGASSALYYDPWSFEFGTSIPHLDRGRLFLEADYQRWSNFVPPSLSISNLQTSSCTNGTYCPLQFTPSQTFPYNLQDIWIFRVGEEWQWISRPTWQSVVRGGVSYRPSILAGTPNNTGNYNFLDPSRWIYTLGVGFTNSPWSFDLFLAYHQLQSQTVVKANSTDIGAPGYTAGGNFIGGGATVSVMM